MVIPPDLSAAEMELLCDKEVFPLKNNITQKLIELLQQLQQDINQSEAFKGFNWPPEIDQTIGKISKGQNYKGQPYLMLDHPRLFTKEGVFAIRTFIWWGNYIGLFLQISGKPLEQYQKCLRTNWPVLKSSLHTSFIDKGRDPWSYDFANFLPAKTEALDTKQEYFKLGAKLELQEYAKLSDWGIQHLERWLQLLT